MSILFVFLKATPLLRAAGTLQDRDETGYFISFSFDGCPIDENRKHAGT